MSKHSEIGRLIEEFGATLAHAQALDALEVCMVLNLPLVKAVPFWSEQIAADATQSANSLSAMTNISLMVLRAAHSALKDNKDATETLHRVAADWQLAASRLSDISDDMTDLLAEQRLWTGVSAEGERRAAGVQVEKQAELIAVAQLVSSGCAEGAMLNEAMMLLGLTAVAGPLVSARAVAYRNPSLANVFGLNSRTRGVAAQLDLAARDYLEVVKGTAWRSAAHGVARKFGGVESVLKGKRAPRIAI